MEREEEALRLKSRAEEKFKLSSLKSALKYAKRAERLHPKLDGISEMVTALRILHVASKSSLSTPPNWYKILQLEPFSHINTIKKHYKKLALILHPDKNTCSASEEAFKHVGEAFRFLSDKIRRKEFDMKLRIALESRAKEAEREPIHTFWTACATCRLLHEFERRYLGHNLVCPSCKKSFLAVEDKGKDSIDDDEEDVRVRGRGLASVEKKRESNLAVGGRDRDLNNEEVVKVRGRVRVPSKKKRDSSLAVEVRISDDELIAEAVDARVRARISSKKNRGSSVASSGMTNTKERTRVGYRLGSSRSKKVKIRHEKTLAEMQLEAKRKTDLEKSKKVNAKDKVRGEKEKTRVSQGTDQASMTVEDSDFYDFDKDRMDRCFKKGQVWAIYDDDDGMPRHYGLIDDTISANPFRIRMIWLDWQNNKDEALICWEKSGFHISCGRFKIGRKIDVDSVNLFSHVVDCCERAAREIYRIYPKKGSVWALYRGENLDGNDGNTSNRRCYDVVVFLTSYSEMNGLSFAHLEKVDGFKTIFKRQEIGCHAIKWLEKDDARLFSHQIPARKLSGEEAMDLPRDCWELDPASLPSDLLRIS